MLDFSSLNMVAIIVAWLVNVIVGSFWYSPAGFGKQWSKLSGVDMMKMPKGDANKAIMAVAIASFVQTIILAVFVQSLGAQRVVDGVLVGLFAWLGFTAATTVGNNLYSRLSWKFWWLNTSFFALIMPLNAVLLTVWQ